ncbi:hypothetical protein [Hymenobacter siberiensis]|uniref:hypothetical protein n=1 Tax=Hymenobacter siberiensis TaxID=2848396 RepID=UPI001C1E5BB1|nr:hypothetical protein [Hymenobacter siberiensis]
MEHSLETSLGNRGPLHALPTTIEEEPEQIVAGSRDSEQIESPFVRCLIRNEMDTLRRGRAYWQ